MTDFTVRLVFILTNVKYGWDGARFFFSVPVSLWFEKMLRLTFPCLIQRRRVSYRYISCMWQNQDISFDSRKHHVQRSRSRIFHPKPNSLRIRIKWLVNHMFVYLYLKCYNINGCRCLLLVQRQIVKQQVFPWTTFQEFVFIIDCVISPMIFLIFWKLSQSMPSAIKLQCNQFFILPSFSYHLA